MSLWMSGEPITLLQHPLVDYYYLPGNPEESHAAPQSRGFNPFGYAATSCLIESLAGDLHTFFLKFKKVIRIFVRFYWILQILLLIHAMFILYAGYTQNNPLCIRFWIINNDFFSMILLIDISRKLFPPSPVYRKQISPVISKIF